MAVYLVMQQSSTVLLQRLRAKGIRNPDHSRALSKSILLTIYQRNRSKEFIQICSGVVTVKVCLIELICSLFFPVKEKLTADPESEIATTSLRVSLLCPVNIPF